MGDESRFALSFFDRTVEADSLTELVAALIAGYSDDETAALLQRHSAAVGLVNARQADLAVEAAEAGEAIDAFTEEQLTALFASRDEIVDVPDGKWESETIPLLLMATDYEPYTDRVKPVGNVKFVDPANERTFLGTLSDVGALTLFVREETAA
ncbi:hypothetical protein [Cellulosimicrobium sp. Marseille-Q4280]|uniref:hypothetical protein n=1 Tax=Cellulosimicrobium sp. Marseille-Q4280 TaxID=2937992 RepID=UPI00203E0D6C|nr:hypothetical protein [Cellulosimicrobium sp. Marseille-Q4280]